MRDGVAVRPYQVSLRDVHQGLPGCPARYSGRYDATSHRMRQLGKCIVTCRLGPDYQATTSVLWLPPLRAGEHSNRRQFQRQHPHQRHCPPSDGT